MRKDTGSAIPARRGQHSEGGRSVNWRAILAAIVLGIAGVPAATGIHAVHAQTVRAAPSLLHAAASHPAAELKVIVEKRGATTVPESLIRQYGGRVTKNLSIINAIAATLPARALRQLAQNDSVNWVAPDALVHQQGGSDGTVNTANLVNIYDRAIGADQMWANGYQGAGVNVAVVDSGITPTADLDSSRIVAATSTNTSDATTVDGYGHGSHVAGIIASNGSASNGQYIGIAPQAGVLNVKVFDSTGASTVSDVVNGLQWINDNRAAYNIKVVNLSLDTTLAQSYNNDPLDAACEVLWFNKIVVVVAAGNNGVTNPGVLYSPANDPFVITVGAVDTNGTVNPSDDTLANFSAYGTTVDGFAKPDVVAPGMDIISTLASPTDELATLHPSHIDGNFFDMSGTSMATPVVAGAAALLLEKNPALNPDQVKYLLESTATPLAAQGSGAGEVNVYAASQSTATGTANTGLAPSAGLQSQGGLGFSTWNSASWGSASWGSASWGSASWGSASWGSASWGSASWGSAAFNSDYWGNTHRHPHGNDNNRKSHG